MLFLLGERREEPLLATTRFPITQSMFARSVLDEQNCLKRNGMCWIHWTLSFRQNFSEAAAKGKSASTPYQEGKADYDRGVTAQSISSYLSALTTIQVYPELDGRTLDVAHCFYNIARYFSR